MKKLLPPLFAVALLAASCGTPVSEIDSDSVVADVLGSAEGVQAAPAPEDTPAPPPSVPPGCVLVIELDEYGFEVEVVDCGERPPIGPEDPDWLGSVSARTAAKLMRAAIVDQAECGTRASYGELKTLVVESLREYRDPLLRAVAALEQGAAHCNKDKDAWAAAMAEAISFLEEFLQAVAANEAAAAAAAEITGATDEGGA